MTENISSLRSVLFTAHERQTIEIEVSHTTLLVGMIDHLKNLKNQALQGFLVDALAHRGDERRDTLR